MSVVSSSKASASRGDRDVAVAVEVRAAAWRHQRGRVVLVDQQRTRARPAPEIGAPDHRRLDRAERGAEVGGTVLAPPALLLAQPERSAVCVAAPARRDTEVDDLDRIALGLVAVRVLVLLGERVREVAERIALLRRGERHRQLERLALVLEVRRGLDLHVAMT